MLYRSSVPIALLEPIERELEPGEHVQWVGMPVPRYYSREVRSTLISSLLSLAFAAVWLAKTLFGGQDAPSPGTATFVGFLSFGVGVLAFGVYLALSPLREYRKWLRRVYMVTDRRMIAFDGGARATLRRFATEPLGDIVRVAHRDGTCDLLIEPGVSTEYDAWSQREPLGFLRIRDADAVEALLPTLASHYSPIDTIEHPTHDRPVSIVFRVGMALVLAIVVPLFLLGRHALAAGLFFTIIAAVIAYSFIHGRRSVCPRCGEYLKRDEDAPRGTYYFTCRECRVRWASRVITT